LNRLHWLDLSETKITDAGLAQLKGLNELETLCLNNTRVTDAGKEELSKALPKCFFVQRY
jgi:hypothetical protein